MAETIPSTRFVFPRWTNYLLLILVVGGAGGALYLPVLAGLGASPRTLNAGYEPRQPVQFSHALHAGQLGLDCRYCHVGVDKGPHSTVPATQVCMNCHSSVQTESVRLAPVFESWKSGKPIEWIRVHDLPDFAYFNHAAHVNRGVSCVSCHGRIDQMDVVAQAQPLSMAWCLDCHRRPELHLRPLDQITNLGWRVEDLPQTNPDLYNEIRAKHEGKEVDQALLGAYLKEQFNIRGVHYMQACSTCHR